MSPNGDMKPSHTELVILKHLWQKQPQSLREIHLAIEPHLNWSRSSTRKTVERMVSKGMLRSNDSHGLTIYRAAIQKIPTLAAMIRSFAAQVLGLDGPLPVSNLLNSRLLNKDELAELEDYLNKINREESESDNDRS